MNPSHSLCEDEPVTSNGPAVDATFVLCVESGPLETQTIMAVESLRRWGGRFSGCPVLAITPRNGAPLTRSTMAAFDRLGVAWHRFHAVHDAPWYGPMNKPAALDHAERLAKSETVVWMDSDVIVIAEPGELELAADEEFAALPGSRIYDLATDGVNEHEPFWRATLEWHGVSEAEYPRIPGHPGEDRAVRMYWQGGVFSYRRSRSLGAAHLLMSSRQIRSRIASSACGAYFTEQVGLALAVHAKGLRYRPLPRACNLMVNPVVEDRVDAAAIEGAKIVHYFGSMWEGSFDRFARLLGQRRPDVAEWVLARGPLRDDRPAFRRFIGRLERHHRKRQGEAYLAGCERH
ncbi:MAG: hypothetical protein KDL87_00060 [Verrucomicrobiae bacterium]|nr:hypothetical protein [Verrucomicrobiae bacterium]